MRRWIGMIILISSIGVNYAVAQSYGSTLGLRFGNGTVRTVGLTFQYRVIKHVTLEGVLQTDFNRNTTAHALIERHHPILTKRMNFYVGTGVSFGLEESEIEDEDTKQVITTFDNPTIGADVILGLEFTLLKYNFSLDYKPNFNITGREPWYTGQVGVSVRAVLVKGSTQNKRRRQRARKRRKKEREKEKEAKEKDKSK